MELQFSGSHLIFAVFMLTFEADESASAKYVNGSQELLAEVQCST